MKKFFKKLVITILVIGCFLYGGYALIEQQKELNNNYSEIDRYTALCESEEMLKEQLTEIKENMSTDSYIEEVAREKLGFVMPYEIIFKDASI